MSSQRPIMDQRRVAHKIEIIKLDDLISYNELDAVDFLKIDVEGAELALLKGCVNLILGLNDFDCFRVCRDRVGIHAMRDSSDFESGDNLVLLLKSSGKRERLLSLIVN